MTEQADDDRRDHGPQTEAAIANFAISGRPVPLAVIDALLDVKWAAAGANADLGVISQAHSRAIRTAIDDITASPHAAPFPVDVFQTGSGTSTNMNVNEVIASQASRDTGMTLHPNDHVNASQSTNDTVPTAIRIAVLRLHRDHLSPALDELAGLLEARAGAWSSHVKAGRTHLMDATPITLGDEFGGYAAQLRDAAARLADARPRLARLPLGGTATGNGVNAPPDFAPIAVASLAERSGLALTEAPDHFAVQGGQDDLVEWSSHLRSLAVALYKIANDIRLLASGPNTGFGELAVPSLQAGSSIMPGKVNPVICEAVMQVCARVLGSDTTVAFAGSQGNLELNVMLPLMADELVTSSDLLTAAMEHLARKCIAGIEPDVERMRAHAERTAALATALTPLIGYDASARIVREALASGRSIRDVAVEQGAISADDAARVLDVDVIARGPRRGPAGS